MMTTAAILQVFPALRRVPASHRHLPRTFGLAVLPLALAACSSGAAPVLQGAAKEVHDLTGARARVVWVQGDGTDPYAMGEDLVLMGFDTHDGQGERVILGERSSYVKPLLTSRGDRIVYSTAPRRPQGPEIFILDWDGSRHRRIGEGFALTVWQDPADGRDWLYVGTDHREFDFATISRFPIDDPSRRELVWNKTMVSGDTFQVSADGRLGGGLFPWPVAGVAELPNGAFRKLGEGCWTALGNPGPSVMWYFDGAHRNLTMVDVETDSRWTVNINQAPGFSNPEVYHPRWTRHPRFLTMTGPYDQGGANQVRSGGTQAEVYLGRFSEDFTRVEGWARVTRNAGGDSYPDVWIEKERSPHPLRASGPIGPDAAAAGGNGAAVASGGAEPGRLVIQARLVSPGPIPTPQSILPYRHALVVSEYEILSISEGEYTARTIQVAQWAIRDTRVLPTARKAAGSEHRLTLERYDAHPELEGERLITDSEASELPLYYDLGS
jgi:hypothetical protein